MLRDINERSVMIWISLLGGPNYLVYRSLLEEFGSLAGIYNAHLSSTRPESIRQFGKAYERFTDRETAAAAGNIYSNVVKSGMNIVTLEDDSFPYRLKNLPSACPLVLYFYGGFTEEDKSGEGRALAVVGSRHCSAAGESNAYSFSYSLAKLGVSIVSGMARGCDGAAHRGALKAGGRTIAVLACGADVVYPPEHKALYNEIIRKGGAIISESPPGTAPVKQLFPARNRIIAGLSDGVLVVEAAKKSGALITADKALEADRLVFALPGDVRNPMAYGVNELIRQGAVCVTDVGVIVEELGLEPEGRNERKPGGGRAIGLPFPQNAVYNAVVQGCSDPDEISVKTQLEVSDICSALTLLEVRGLIRSSQAGKYIAS